MNSHRFHLFSTILIASIILITSVLPGCGQNDEGLSITAGGFTFSRSWEKIIEITGADESLVRLNSYEIQIKDEKVRWLSSEFLADDDEGQPRIYYVQMDAKGEYTYDSYESSYNRTGYNPYILFQKLGRYASPARLSELQKTSIRIRVSSEKRVYDMKDIFEINAGFQPLRRVSFNTTQPWASIEVYQQYPEEPGYLPVLISSLRKGMGEVWFISEDLGKADEVIYLKNKQGPAFQMFIKNIYGQLPPGWEMSLNTQESMHPPEGLDEPLFSLYFKDTENHFTITNGVENWDIIPSLRLYFYGIKEKEEIMEIIEQQSIYSWDIPEYFDESDLYIAVTSPGYINSGHFADEMIGYYNVLDEKLKNFFFKSRKE